ncbi:Cro/CI family transcriptional regulator [Acinetobacter nosocomialis]|uniref:Cro/CI family transcriptional regulator n=1 Tax=Acinetobacter nosocomialis TaxID=106654 RepID=UPI001B83B795|nr:Cro/CI family transcriptional regulator [Acinetobacter nosocomialis]MBR7715568.1 helix-turn-helix domain-containing protein [Acinetobacter nosocomialis]
MQNNQIKEVVSYFGSQRKTATALDITQPTVNHMISTGQVSVKSALIIQMKTNGQFKALDLCPELKNYFTELTVA